MDLVWGDHPGKVKWHTFLKKTYPELLTLLSPGNCELLLTSLLSNVDAESLNKIPSEPDNCQLASWLEGC